MNPKQSARFAAPLLTLALAGALPSAALAQASTGAWQYEASIYGWFPSIGGSTSFPATGTGPSIDVSAKDVIDALKFTFMGSFEAKKGQWGLWTDLVYADFGASKQGSRDFTVDHHPVSVDANLQLDVKSWIWTLAGTYNLATTPDYTLDALGGFRYLDLAQTLGWTLSTTIPQLPGRTGSADADITNWDAVVGIKGRAMLGADRKWFIPYYLDIGTGQSKFTWQVNAGVGYNFDWGAVIATWRYLDYEFKSGHPIESMNFNGPTIGVAFRW
jgi:hypothetical protein